MSRLVCCLALSACVDPTLGQWVGEPKDTNDAVSCTLTEIGGEMAGHVASLWADPEYACLIQGGASGVSLLPLSIGSGGVTRTFTGVTQVQSYLAGTATSAQTALGQQLLVARLNAATYPWISDLPVADITRDGVAETHAQVVARGDALYAAGTNTARRRLTSILSDTAADAQAACLDADGNPLSPAELCGPDDTGLGED